MLKAQLVNEKAAPYCVRRVLMRAASAEPLADPVRAFCEDLEQSGDCQDWQVRQAEALRIYCRSLSSTFVYVSPRLSFTVQSEYGRSLMSTTVKR